MVDLEGDATHVLESPQSYIVIIDDAPTPGVRRQFLLNRLTLEDLELPVDKVIRIKWFRHTRRSQSNDTAMKCLCSER